MPGVDGRREEQTMALRFFMKGGRLGLGQYNWVWQLTTSPAAHIGFEPGVDAAQTRNVFRRQRKQFSAHKS